MKIEAPPLAEVPATPPDRLLVVDDDEQIRKLLVTVMKRQGFDVEQAANGAEALEAIASRQFDVMLLDLMMPVVSGFEVLDKLDDANFPPRCVLVVSAVPEHYLQLVKNHASAIIGKPFDVSTLGDRVRECLSQATASDRPA